MTTAQTLVHTLTHAIQLSKDFEDCHAKLLLWCLALSLQGITILEGIFSKQGFLTENPICVDSHDHGLFVYTVRDGQVNLNLLLASSLAHTSILLAEALAFFERNYAHYSYDLRFIREQLPVVTTDVQCTFHRRRVVLHRDRVAHATLSDDGTRMACDGREAPVVKQVDASTARTWMTTCPPLSTLTADHTSDVVYWHRFPCGRTALVRNPLIDEEVPALTASTQTTDNLVDDCPSELVELMHQLLLGLQAKHAYECDACFSESQLPHTLREICAYRRAIRHGIDDRFVELVGRHLPARREESLLANATFLYDLLTSSQRCSAERFQGILASRFARVLSMTKYRSMWTAWLATSKHAMRLLNGVTPALLVHLLREHPPLLDTLARLLDAQSVWNNDRLQQACILEDFANEALLPDAPRSDLIQRVLARLLQLRNKALACSRTLLVETTTPTARGSGARSARPGRGGRAKALSSPPLPRKAGDDAPAVVVPAVAATHVGRGAALQAWLGWPCTLIGSGLYCDESDMDVVVHMPSTLSVSEAYARVVEKTGWTPLYESVEDGRAHVAILEGRWEGRVVVEAQVFCDGPTPMEEETRRALSLWSSLLMDERNVRGARRLRDWFARHDLKGQCAAKTSGVGIACLAVWLSSHLLWSEETDPLASMLRLLHDEVLSREAPCVEVGTADDGKGARGRCTSPLVVIAQERANLTSHMTVATTRFLADVLALPDVGAYSREALVAWRKRHMVPAARPPRTLLRHAYKALARLDGHPVIESAFLDDEGVLWVSLQAARDDKYAFRDTDVVECDDGGESEQAWVRRGDRRWPLMMHTSRVPSVSRAVSSDSHRFVPNVPTLTVDVLHGFSCAIRSP